MARISAYGENSEKTKTKTQPDMFSQTKKENRNDPKETCQNRGICRSISCDPSMLVSPRVLRAQHDNDDDNDNNESKIQIGFRIAPVKLNMAGKVRDLVGLGSYIVNAQADCAGCHSAGPPTEFTASGNPYLLRPVFSGKKAFNPATYLGGGNDFGAFPAEGPFPHIVSRNLTPDKTGLPEGGATFQEFLTIMRTGK